MKIGAIEKFLTIVYTLSLKKACILGYSVILTRKFLAGASRPTIEALGKSILLSVGIVSITASKAALIRFV